MYIYICIFIYLFICLFIYLFKKKESIFSSLPISAHLTTWFHRTVEVGPPRRDLLPSACPCNRWPQTWHRLGHRWPAKKWQKPWQNVLQTMENCQSVKIDPGWAAKCYQIYSRSTSVAVCFRCLHLRLPALAASAASTSDVAGVPGVTKPASSAISADDTRWHNTMLRPGWFGSLLGWHIRHIWHIWHSNDDQWQSHTLCGSARWKKCPHSKERLESSGWAPNCPAWMAFAKCLPAPLAAQTALWIGLAVMLHWWSQDTKYPKPWWADNNAPIAAMASGHCVLMCSVDAAWMVVAVAVTVAVSLFGWVDHARQKWWISACVG